MVVMNLVQNEYYLVCLFILFIQTENYYDLSTVKNTLYSVDLNLNNEAIWKQEHIWFQSEDQSIGNVVHPLLSTKPVTTLMMQMLSNYYRRSLGHLSLKGS